LGLQNQSNLIVKDISLDIVFGLDGVQEQDFQG
jgi:hypothetical protein